MSPKEEKEKPRLRGAAMLQYIWDYYKLRILLVGICLYVVCYLAYRNVTAEYPQLYLAYVNLDVGETLNKGLTEGFISCLAPSEKNSVVKTLPGLALTESLQRIDTSYLYASQMKILSAIDSQRLDIVLMNQEAFDAFSQNGFLTDLTAFAERYDLSALQPFFVENIEILTDNAAEVIVDPSAEYHSEVTSYPMAIDISEFPMIREAGFPDRVFLGIIANSPRTETAAAFVSYLSGSKVIVR
ncbi:MAG: hypothetical protein IKF39_09180 [Oscillospiraceae bacterium]|nr:hypothetical protein [Oscillospiraceae bacterium]